MAVDAEEDLLGEVGGLVGVAGQAEGEVVDHLGEAGVDLVEGGGVAVAVALGEIEVAVVHGGGGGAGHGTGRRGRTAPPAPV